MNAKKKKKNLLEQFIQCQHIGIQRVYSDLPEMQQIVAIHVNEEKPYTWSLIV